MQEIKMKYVNIYLENILAQFEQIP